MEDDISIAFDKLKEELVFLQHLFDELPSTIHILKIDKAGNTMAVWANQEYERIIGYTLEERRKMKPSDLYHPDDLEQVRDAVRNAFTERSRGGVLFRVKCKDGKWKWMYIFSKRFTYKNDSNHLLSVGIEISNEFSFNHSKAQEYIKEITRLKNQVSLSKLTKVEQEVLDLLARGKTIKEIAGVRHRSPETINNHKRNIFKKLGFSKIAELVAFAAEHGLG